MLAPERRLGCICINDGFIVVVVAGGGRKGGWAVFAICKCANWADLCRSVYTCGAHARAAPEM